MSFSPLRAFAVTILITAVPSSLVSLAAEEIEFNRDIRPIISGTCLTCHGPDEAAREADLRLDTFAGATADRGGYAAIVAGDADASAVFERVTSDDEDLLMPPPGKGKRLTADEVERLRNWIQSGAKYEKHWSYVPPTQVPLPQVTQTQWPKNASDYFILEKIEAAGLQPSPAADNATIARRVALALTGLPPTPNEVAKFVNDQSDDAYERFVDAQFAKPAFGERWARVWLDLARYADSAGYADDPARTIWAYRDYVIRSLNENKPFDQFTIDQIAGDLLDNPTEQQLIATAFHRNTMTNNEGGTNDEQFRNEAVVDRVNTTMAVWMGTTMACAQCHTHKYDPITQEEYFRFFDIFNQTQDADRRDESPLVELWSDTQLQTKRQLADRIEALRQELKQQTPELDEALDQWKQAMRSQPQWQSLVCDTAGSDFGKLEISSDGGLELVGDIPEHATYTLRFPLAETRQVSALRLEIPETQKSNFVLSRVRATFEPQQAQPQLARYVRLELPGKKHFLHVAEIQVFSGGTNIAPTGKASQSSTDFGGAAERAVDGNTDGTFTANSVTHTAADDDPWLEIDLGDVKPIDSVVVWNRTDGGESIQRRLNGYRIVLLGGDRQPLWLSQSKQTPSPSETHDASGIRHLKFTAAVATYSQPKFPAASVLEGVDSSEPPSPKTGWAIGGKTGQTHELNLIVDQAVELTPGTLILRIDQVSDFSQHLITALHVSTTADKRVQEWAGMPDAIRKLVQRADLASADRDRLAEYFRTITPLLDKHRNELKQLEEKLAAMKAETTVPVMRELALDKRRVTRVQQRGNYQSLLGEVTAGVPAAFHPIASEPMTNRLSVAKWLVARDNPLTARVIANRHWEEIFGTGIVETSEEFGSQGELPSHPELLDWLAVDLMDSGWDLKHLLKHMVMSATYRQSSAVSAELLELDPHNRLYARGPRFRISAEMVRDQALAISGLLSDSMYGIPVQPPQPDFGLKAAFGSGTDWKTSEGGDRYRRAIYTTWRRSNPYPSMATFDAPNREVCTVRRSRTNTPLQALVTLNDPVYVEAAQALTRRVAGESSLEKRITKAFQWCLQRDPTAAEQQRLVHLYQSATAHFESRSDAALSMATKPLGPLPENQGVLDAAAFTVVAGTLLNLDETLMPK